jgi:glycine cleavage system H protein
MNVPDDLKYTPSHEWLRLEGANARVGITDHAQAELTDIVYVELPKAGRQVKAGETIAVVESVKAASDIYAPVSGTVIEANDALGADPGLINRDPFGEGWMFVISVEAGEELENLKTPAEYGEIIAGSGK